MLTRAISGDSNCGTATDFILPTMKFVPRSAHPEQLCSALDAKCSPRSLYGTSSRRMKRQAISIEAETMAFLSPPRHELGLEVAVLRSHGGPRPGHSRSRLYSVGSFRGHIPVHDRDWGSANVHTDLRHNHASRDATHSRHRRQQLGSRLDRLQRFHTLSSTLHRDLKVADDPRWSAVGDAPSTVKMCSSSAVDLLRQAATPK